MIPKTSELPFGRLRGFRRSFQAADVHGGPEMGGVRVPPLPGGDPHRQAWKPRGLSKTDLRKLFVNIYQNNDGLWA